MKNNIFKTVFEALFNYLSITILRLFDKKKFSVELVNNKQYKLTVIAKSSKKFDYWMQVHLENYIENKYYFTNKSYPHFSYSNYI